MASESDGLSEMEWPAESSQTDPYFSPTAHNVSAECDRCILADHRIFYLHRRTRRSYWIPPRVAWRCNLNLDYGIERAIDEFGTYYFICHLAHKTSYENPVNSRKSTQAMEPASTSSSIDSGQVVVPPTRSYEIWRSKQFNFGFIASSERPVVIQFVTPGGPSDGRLLPRDQILSVNGVDVRHEDKLGVVEMIRKSTTVLRLEVAQPPRKLENGVPPTSSRRVRFTERIVVAGSTEANLPVLSFPNAIKIYAENGQIKSLRYNAETTIQEILNILMEKLQITQPDHFALGIEQSVSLSPAKISFLPNTLRVQTCVKSSFPEQRFRLRLAFPPRELLNYSKDDPAGFDYFYQQCVNDFVDGRHMEIRYEASLRLAALHIRQVCTETTSRSSNSPNVHHIEREYGLATFLPTIWLEKIKPRDLREHLQFFLNKDEETFNDLKQYLAKQKALNRSSEFLPKNASIDVSADIARIIRIKYVTLISLLPDFGVVYFNVNYKPTNVDMIVQLDSRYGVIVRYPGKGSPPAITINFPVIEGIHVFDENEMTTCMCLKLAQSGVNAAQRSLDFFVDRKDVENLVAYIVGYAKLFGNKNIQYFEHKPSSSASAPPYRGLHFVSPAGWNYPSSVDPKLERAVNLAHGPPTFEHAIVSTNQYDSSIPADEPYIDPYASPKINRQSPIEPDFIDEESPTVEMNPMPRRSVDKFLPTPIQQRRRSSQQRFTQMLVGTAHALLLKNRATTKRLRDSLRIHRQRHSVPNANPARSISPIAERRWSSATRRDTIASTCSNDNPCISRSALTISVDNTTNGKYCETSHFLDSSSKPHASHSNWANSARASFLRLPTSVINKLYANSANNQQKTVATHSKLTGATNSLKPNPQQKRLVEELKRSQSLDGKHVTFNFSCNAVILPPPSPDPSVTPEDFNDKQASKPVDDEFVFQPYITLCTKKFGQLSTSRTFPMEKNSQDFGEDFGEDFCPKSKSCKQPPEPVNPNKPTIRRMSLKEFSGLENVQKPAPRHNSAAFQNGFDSPILSRLQSSALGNQALSTTRSNEYLDKCGSRRRSSSGLYGSNFGSREHVYEPFDKVIDEISSTVDGFNLDPNRSEPEKVGDLTENVDPEQILGRVDLIRKRLSITLEKIPTQSPKRRMSVDVERNKILSDIGRLSQASKHLIRSVYSPISANERQENVINTIQLADRVSQQCEQLLEQRATYYQAHLLKAELDQLLRALSDTIRDANNAAESQQRYGPEFRKLSRSTTSLAAAFTQFLRAIKSF